VRITFLGDISLNNKYTEFYIQGLNPFIKVEPILSQSDFVVGNLECMAKGRQGENTKKRPRLSTEVETLNYLKDIHLDVACLAHNHIYDHLEDGYKRTTDFLNANGIQYLGAGFTNSEIEKELILEKDGVSVALLNYLTSDTNPNIPRDAILQPNWFDLNKIASKIKDIRTRVDHIVLLLHWGGKAEGKLYPDPALSSLAHNLISLGADLIIGGHSHTIHPFEVYNGKYIFYSLGNFCFADIIFDGDIIYQDKNRRSSGLVPIFTISKTSIKLQRINYVKNTNLFLTFKVGISKPRNYIWNQISNRKWLYNSYLKYEKFYKYYSIIFIDGINHAKSPIGQLRKIFLKR
jgi:poly-gamma-glutamate synthesis protein (capsule biosynthesis protein)